MSGFIISNKNIDVDVWTDCFEGTWVKNEDIVDEFYVHRKTINKFMNDKIFSKRKEAFIVLEGVILNKQEILSTNEKNSLEEYILNNKSKVFFNEFRGTFSGACYSVEEKKWIVYTNHVGDKPVFYYCKDDIFVASTSLLALVKLLSNYNIRLEMETKAAYDILTYGTMCSRKCQVTPIKDVWRLRPGCYLEYKKTCNQVLINEYFRFTNSKEKLVSLSEEEIIEKIDSLFQSAIKREYDKDLEYGYKFLSSMSGGLDSRMNSWVAKEMGYYDITNLTFSQSQYADQIIAQEIAAYLQNELIVLPLDSAVYLQNIDEVVKQNYGLSLYSGTAHGYNALKKLNMKEYGLLHTGQLGDVVISSFCNVNNNYAIGNNSNRIYSDALIERVEDVKITDYENFEMFMIYTRAFGAMTSQIAMSKMTEIVSPFVDVDFMQFCLNIPIEYRQNHYIYKKWIINKYPQAAKFKWEGIDAKLTASKVEIYIKKIYKRGLYKLLNILKIDNSSLQKNKTMNPMDYWYKNNAKLKQYMDKYFFEHIKIINNQQLKKDLYEMYIKGNVREKTQVLTVVGVYKIYGELINE